MSARWLVAIVVGLGLLLVAANALVRQISFESFRDALDARLSRRLGVDVDVTGAIHLELLPRPQLEVEGLVVENWHSRSKTYVLEIGRFSLDIEILPLFRRVVLVDAIEISDATLHIRPRVGPHAEAHSTPAAKVGAIDEPSGTPASEAEFQIRRVSVDQFRVVYERVSGSIANVEFEHLELDADDSAHPVHINGAGRYEGREFELVAETGSVTELLESSAPFPVDARVHFAKPELEVELTGTIETPRRLAGLDLRFTARARDASALFLNSVGLVSMLGSQTLTGRLRNPDGTLGVDDLHIESDAGARISFQADGSVRDLFKFAGVDLSVEASTEDLRILGELISGPLPEGPVCAEFRVSDADGSLGIEAAAIHFARPEFFTLDLRGSIDDIREVDEIRFEFDLAVRDLDVVGALFDTQLPAIGPIELTGHVRASSERLTSQGQLVVGTTRFSTHWEFSFAPGKRRLFTADLRSPHLRLADFSPARSKIERVDLNQQDETSFFEHWWSGAQDLRFDALRDFDLDVHFQAQRLSGSAQRLSEEADFELDDVAAHLVLDRAELEIKDVRARYQGGRIDASLRIDVRPESPHWAFQLEAYHVDLTRNLAQFETGGESVGHLDVSADLTSRGSTRADLTSALDGRIGAILREGNLLSQYGRAVSLDFLRISVPQFLKRRDPETSPSIHCLLAIAPITDGVAQVEQFYLVGDGITVAGTGSVDLPLNRLKLRLAPRLDNPGLVGVAVTVDVTGPLEAPVFSPVPHTLASSAARSVFDNAMRPVRSTLRIGLGREPKPTDDPCTVAALAHLREGSLGTSGVD